MAKCSRKQLEKKAVCIGDMREKIQVQIRSITAPTTDGVDYGESFISLKTVWALVETTRGETIFDGTNVERDVTHRFYIRYLPDVTFEDWIIYKGNYYDIIDVENLQELNDFLLIRVNVRGTTSKEVNQS